MKERKLEHLLILVLILILATQTIICSPFFDIPFYNRHMDSIFTLWKHYLSNSYTIIPTRFDKITKKVKKIRYVKYASSHETLLDKEERIVSSA